MSNTTQSNTTTGTSTVWQIVGRLVTAAIVLAITAFFTPNFSSIAFIKSIKYENNIQVVEFEFNAGPIPDESVKYLVLSLNWIIFFPLINLHNHYADLEDCIHQMTF